MKKIDFIHSLKQVFIVGAVTTGMLIVSIHNSSALTEEEILPEEPIIVEEATVPVIEAPVAEEAVVETPVTDTSNTDTTNTENLSPEVTDSDVADTNAADTDASNNETANTDSEITDSETPDTEVPDVEVPDAEVPDVEMPDVETPDANTPDTDIETPDAELPDTNASGSETPDTETSNPDTSVTEPSVPSTDSNDEKVPEKETSEKETSKKETSKKETPQKESSKPNLSHQEDVTVKPDQKINDKKKDAVYIQQNYIPSGTFVNDEDKIKYNVALPIDNIPSFITQEMIIGALKCQDETGYPASVTIAQIIQESGFGKYGPGGDERQGLSYLAFQYCNLFGIKGNGPAGSVNMRTGEQAPSGERYTINAGFRVYNTYTECIEDRTDILKRVYKDLTSGVKDANTFAMKIGSRWATSLQYGKHLITQMKRYDLYRLDEMTLQDFSQMIGEFADPCPGSYKTSSFGYREFDNKFHKGVDFGTNGEEIPTYAVAAGTVVIAGYNASAGNWIVIDHGNGLVTKYMHHSKLFVVQGQEVEKGQQIGLTGDTGRSFGVHLHFQVEENGVAVDPETYLYATKAK